ncbi:TetR/AcrR family transcriptional regulator [Sphingopyxis sp. YF1]|uniref:TetR/AcrR family transcriptional regulator n=1 Tax=Sphingopyxis sp. YF1 TaxID=2482763 RepID=UPI001F616E93|nr:TetR/AcrR family transcriptional regulator [Sphingopyxis sp. YF1]UNU44414.1 TetR/AcrR family transcriptional regulator [Sphingopyxis sp. YF1]
MMDQPRVAMPDAEAGNPDKVPRTERGRRTLRKLLDAAAVEFGERGFHDASISGITRRAGTALGSFYTYFDSKDAIFRGLVADMSNRVRDHVAPAMEGATGAIDAEGRALAAFLQFARAHQEIYRIVDEAEFVDPDSFRAHYATTAERIAARLQAGGAGGELRDGLGEVEAWAIMGMNVFLGLRFGVWDTEDDVAAVAARANALIADGIRKR